MALGNGSTNLTPRGTKSPNSKKEDPETEGPKRKILNEWLGWRGWLSSHAHDAQERFENFDLYSYDSYAYRHSYDFHIILSD